MEILTEADPDRIQALVDAEAFFWLDLRDPSAEDLELVGRSLGLHPMALEDTREWGQRPKVEPYGDDVFIVFFTVGAAQDGHAGRATEVHLFISGGFLVTARRGACAELDLLRGRLQLGTDEPEDYFVYRILDGLTDAYYPLITETEERIDALESEVLTRPRPGQLERIYRLKQQVQAHQRHVTAQRDAFPAAVEAILALPTLSHGTRPYLRDVADHLAQVAAELQRQAGDLTSLTETFFNANANKLNESAARLSVIATFFVVGTLVTGFFGQNFGWLVSHIESRTDFLLLGVAGPLALLGALSAYFWRRRGDWL